jgi:hypothetical protein
MGRTPDARRSGLVFRLAPQGDDVLALEIAALIGLSPHNSHFRLSMDTGRDTFGLLEGERITVNFCRHHLN